jgi:hypothetical protein
MVLMPSCVLWYAKSGPTFATCTPDALRVSLQMHCLGALQTELFAPDDAASNMPAV